MQVVKRSAQKNGSFQKLFALPAEEFLINDFACASKRKILIQVCPFCASVNALAKFAMLYNGQLEFFTWIDSFYNTQ